LEVTPLKPSSEKKTFHSFHGHFSTYVMGVLWMCSGPTGHE